MINDTNAVVLAEYRLLNALYNNPELFNEAVSEELFTHSQSQTVFEALKYLSEAKVPLNRESLWQAASERDLGMTSSIIDQIITLSDTKVENISDILTTLSNTKKDIEATACLEEAKKAINSNVFKSEEERSKIKDLLYKAEEVILSDDKKQGPLTAEEWGNAYMAEYAERRNGRKYMFNDIILDDLVSTGPAPGCGGLITASSGMGKSSYVLNLINRLMLRNIPVMYFSLEMGKIDTYDRLLSMRTQIPFKSLVNPSDPSEWASNKEAIEEAKKDIDNTKLFRFCDDPTLTLNDIRSYIKKFQLDIGQEYCIVILDLITMVQDFASVKNGVSLANQIEFAINKLNAISKELNIHYIGVAQLNRSVEQDKVRDPEDIEKLRPNRASIKNSNALLERTRYVISLFRPKYFADTYLDKEEFPELEEMEDIIEVGLMKANNSMTGRRSARFDGDTFLVSPIKNIDDELDED